MVSHVRVRWVPALLAAMVGVVTACLLAGPAAAHTDLISVDPADGAGLEKVPSELTLEFSEEMDPGLSTVTVQVDGGAPTTLEVTAGRSASILVATVPSSLAAQPGTVSRWRSAFRVVSKDGHPVAGESSFTVRTADAPREERTSAAPTPAGEEAHTSPPSGGDDSDIPWGLVAAAVAVLSLLLLTVLAAVRLLKRDPDA
ncbi:copper resistance protein CopC [Nocardioides seonyuensis]|uniref:Copper resistance protein CopC n=1 Tax=Nocardioides seonyuensis TaxID=2518371 RepID=A0A4P7IIM0_9ACTN|nr:copper resistance CopC family protein [Nocardioides seonyuensis]QBX57269.1 copper resistance protein CopC [Nocardioides seonyuensis]